MASYVSDPRTGNTVAFNITTATLVKGPPVASTTPAPGIVAKVMVITLGTTAASINDSLTVAGAAIGNQLAAIAASAPVGTIAVLELPFSNGLVVTPGTSGVLAVSYS